MNTYVMLVLSLLAYTFGTVCKKCYTDRRGAELKSAARFSVWSSLAGAVVLLCFGGLSKPSTFTVLLAVAFGATVAIQGIANIAALGCGPMSFTTVIVSFSTLISAMSGVLFFDEQLTPSQIIGIVLMLASFVLAVKPDRSGKRINLKWILLSLVAFAANGGIGIMQKVHQSSAYKDELSLFLIIAFLVSAAVCALCMLPLGKQRKQQVATEAATPRWMIPTVMILGGACVALNHRFNLHLSGVMDSAVFFPIANGGGLILTTIAAVVLFRERLAKLQWLGIMLGIASVIFLCNPFG